MRRILLLTLLMVSGCAALPLAALSTALGLAGTAIGTGSEVYSMGKLDSAENVPLEDLRVAVLKGAGELSLTRVSEKFDPISTTIEFSDDRKSKIEVTLNLSTPTLTRLRINVGPFGNEPSARLFLHQTREHLPHDAKAKDDVP